MSTERLSAGGATDRWPGLWHRAPLGYHAFMSVLMAAYFSIWSDPARPFFWWLGFFALARVTLIVFARFISGT